MANRESASGIRQAEHASTETLALIERIRSGSDDAAAVEELYRRARAVLLATIRRTIGARLRPRLDADDVLHTAFVRAMESLDSFEARDDRAFFAWIRTIARHAICDVHRRPSVGQVRIDDDPASSRLGRFTTLPHGGSVASKLARREWIDRNLRKLKDKEAEVIRLRALDGLSFASIASRWAMTEEAVRRYYSRSITRLREVASPLEGGSS